MLQMNHNIPITPLKKGTSNYSGTSISLFVSLDYCGWKYCSLVYCERKHCWM